MRNDSIPKRLLPKKLKPRKPAARRRLMLNALVLPNPLPPRELAGKWVAWSNRRIVASGDTLAEVVHQVKAVGIEDASYDLLPMLASRVSQ
jgi:Family of unknown function (DUF5678)